MLQKLFKKLSGIDKVEANITLANKMWPFEKKEYKLPELKSVTFGNYEFFPTDDITAKDVAFLLPVFGSIGMIVNIESYVKTHGLERHFKKVKDYENN